MSNYVEVVVIVEGPTEEIFINRILKKYLASKKIRIDPISIGGKVIFRRVEEYISNHLEQRNDTYVSTFFDYYGIGEKWPGWVVAQREKVPSDIASIMNSATQEAIDEKFSKYQSDMRFIPYIAVHEFEALLFSDPTKIASTLNVDKNEIQKIIDKFEGPEEINDSPMTAPSKRLEKLYPKYKDQKTSTGIDIAEDIGIPTMREKCKVFDEWLCRLEELKPLVKEDSE